MGYPNLAERTEYAKLKWSPRGLLPTGIDPVCAAGVDLSRRGMTSAVLDPTGIRCETAAGPPTRVYHVI